MPAYADEIVTDESRENFLDQLSLDALCSNQDDFSMTYEFKMGDRILYHQTRIAYVYKKDRSRVAVIGTRNIDDLIKKERMQEAKLKEAYIVAEEANKAKTDFLSNMSHDIRTPMNAIIGMTSLIRHDAGNKAKVIEYADKIDISSQHLLGIINDVLDMSKIEAGKTVFKYTDFSILDFITELNTIFHPQIAEKNQTLTVAKENI